MNFHKSYIILLVLLFSGMCISAVSAQGQGTRDSLDRDNAKARAAYIEGLRAFENENYEEAVKLLSAAYTKLPNYSGINYALADAYLQMDDLGNAAEFGKQATALEPGNKWYHLKLAEIYREAGRNQATIDELNKALEYHPDATDVIAELARTYAQHGKLLKSNQMYNKLLKHTGSEISIHLQKLNNFNQLGIEDSVIAELQVIRRLDPDNLSTMRMLGKYYRQIGKPEQAKSMLKNALGKNSRDPETLTMLADMYAEEAQWDSVSILLGNVVSDTLVNPEPKITVTRFILSRYRDNPDNEHLEMAADTIIDKLRRGEPDYGQAHALAADFYSATQQREKALEALARTNELLPGNSNAWIQRLQYLLQESNFEKAIEVGQKANEESPQNPFILFYTGGAYLNNGQHRAAVEWLEKATRMPARKELKSVIVGSLGDAYAGMDQWQNAFESYEQALELNPQNDTALNNYAYYLSLQKERLDQAEQMATRAIQLAADDQTKATYLDTIGWVYFQKGEYELARKYIAQSIELGEASGEVLEHMGDVMEQLGRLGEARSWWEKALQKDPSRTYLKDKISS